MEVIHQRFRAMGCRASVSVCHDDEKTARSLVDRACRRVAHLERCWSRFDDMSDVSAINRASGRSVRVDPSTILLVQSLVVAHRLTGGRCRPSYLSDPDLDPDAIVRIHIDSESGVIQAPQGLRLDPGCVGKGLASDLVAEQLVSGGAQGALVEIGGDLRAAGLGPHEGFWSIGVDDPFDEEAEGGRLLVRSGGVSTSGLAVRAEITGPQNVPVDPVSRQPLDVCVDRAVSATVVAGTAFEAEVWSTAMLVTGSPDLSELRQRGYVGRVVMGSGVVHATDEWSRVVSVNEVVDV